MDVSVTVNDTVMNQFSADRDTLQCYSLADALRRYPNVESLDLSCADLADEGVRQLCPSLARLFRLKKLDLSANGITYESLLPLVNVLKLNNTVVSLNQSSNPLGDRGVMVLSSWTRGNCALQKLTLNNVGMTGASGYQLVHFGHFDIEAYGNIFSPAVVRRFDVGIC